jgi:hypothetical protein
MIEVQVGHQHQPDVRVPVRPDGRRPPPQRPQPRTQDRIGQYGHGAGVEPGRAVAEPAQREPVLPAPGTAERCHASLVVRRVAGDIIPGGRQMSGGPRAPSADGSGSGRVDASRCG